MKIMLIGLIRAYRVLISPLYLPVCRFQPTCSQYAIEAIAQHGARKGIWLALRRVLRCHPFHPGGYDPVPPLTDVQGKASQSAEQSSNSENAPY